MNYTNLFVETNYSMNGSNIKIKDLIKRAKAYGYKTLAITDRFMFGSIKFYKECLKNDIKPLIGLNIKLEGILPETFNNFLLYAKNNKGYQNIIKIASISSINGIVTLSELIKHNNGVIFVLNTELSEINNYFNNNQIHEYEEVLSSFFTISEDLYFGLGSNIELNNLLYKKQKCVTLDYVHYMDEEDYKVSNILKKIFNIDIDDLFSNNIGNHFKTKDEIILKFKDYPKAIENTYLIGNMCNVTINFDKTHLPSFKLKQDVTSKEYLNALVYKGLEKRLRGYKGDKKIYLDRLKYELDVIDSMGYNDYFLIVWDFVKYAKSKKYLVGPGRGSAAASLVSYCLGITSVDSIKYDLVFERFLNPERITLPDIDMDLPDDKRDDIITYVRDFYGINKVASICTFGTFLAKSALRDTARVLDIEGLLLKQILKSVEKYDNIKDAIFNSTELNNIMDKDENALELLTIASNIEGLHKHVSTHAAGIIITSDDLTAHTPVQKGLLDMMQTQYEAKDLEDLGLLKIDFLGLRNLTSINKIVNLINENENTNIDIYKTPLDDPQTFELLRRVETTGLFQLESPGMRSLIGQMQIQNFDDIVTVLALFRPGPMENIPSYIKRRFKKETVTYPHKILEEILKSTNGIIIYQEQIIKVANMFAGYSFGEADVLRRAVSKKQESVLEKERANFISKSLAKGHTVEVSNEIYDYFVKFANYGFNKAHSVAYAMVSYWMAYLKANYPKYFISVLLSSVVGSEKQTRNYIYESNKIGVKILPPSVNYSGSYYIPEDNNLRFPLLGIKNVGINAVTRLLEERQNGTFKSYFDFVSRVNSFLNKRVIESLISSSALDEFGFSKRTMIEKLDEVISFSEYGNFIAKEEFILEDLEEYPFITLEENEKKVLGFNLVINPLNEYDDYIKKHKLLKPSTIDQVHVGKQVRLVAMVSNIKAIKTKKGENMAFITIQDEYQKIEGVLFTTAYNQYYSDLENTKVYLFMVKVEERNNNFQLVIQKVHKLTM